MVQMSWRGGCSSLSSIYTHSLFVASLSRSPTPQNGTTASSSRSRPPLRAPHPHRSPFSASEPRPRYLRAPCPQSTRASLPLARTHRRTDRASRDDVAPEGRGTSWRCLNSQRPRPQDCRTTSRDEEEQATRRREADAPRSRADAPPSCVGAQCTRHGGDAGSWHSVASRADRAPQP